MYAYYRSTCYSTAVQKVLHGALSAPNVTEILLVKGNSIQLLTMPMTTGDTIGTTPTPTLMDLFKTKELPLKMQFEQSLFGTIGDIRLMRCSFNDTEMDISTDLSEEESEEEEEDFLRIKRRGKTSILGQDVAVAVSEYGKLVFWTLSTAQDADTYTTGRFECISELSLDSHGLEYEKVCKKLAVDP
ncbi:hypothetical protein BDF14DRAFT_545024 [Spinellus fusiger]|nr:hypothetical protein BDF14DRAFT_545024 [Spinellus fusiger]